MNKRIRESMTGEYVQYALVLGIGACIGIGFYSHFTGRADRQAGQGTIEGAGNNVARSPDGNPGNAVEPTESWEEARAGALQALAEMSAVLSNMDSNTSPVPLSPQPEQAVSPLPVLQNLPPAQPDPPPVMIPLSLPMNGEAAWHVSGEPVGPLEIKTAQGSHYYVRIADASNGRPVLDVFIRSGQSVNIEVPVGQYVIKYASGNVWYGPEQERLFGPDTVFGKADRIFSFSYNGNRIQGYSITLYAVPNGNLSTSRIPRQSF